MRSLVIFFLATLVGCYGDECLEKIELCMADYMQAFTEDMPYKVCKKSWKAVGCMEKNVESYCAGHELEDRIISAIEQLMNEHFEFCEKNARKFSLNADRQKCFEENEENAMECIPKGIGEAFEDIGDEKDSENIARLNCNALVLISQCAMNRIGEKCGAEAARSFMTMISEITLYFFKDSCDQIGFVFNAEALDIDKRKK